MTSGELILQKALVASDLDSSQWNQIQAGFRNRAFFSSQVAKMNILEAIHARTVEYVKRGGDISEARKLMRQDLEKLKYAPEPGKEGTIKDLFTKARLDVILKTNEAQARGYIEHVGGMKPGAFAAFPAQEFKRVEARKAQRQDWPARWSKAGGKFYGDRMIALKDDPVWVKLSVFGNPFPPFDWGSGMGVRDIDRDEAEKLGLITREELKKKVETLRQKPAPDFNANLQATVLVEGRGENVKKMRDLFGEDFGDLVKVDGNVVKWRPEVLRETVLQGKNFTVKLGKPQDGMLGKLRANPKLEPFADAIEGKQLYVTQDWLKTKRTNGTPHSVHFAEMADQPDDIPLRPEDFEMLPCMWRNPDRVIKLGRDLFLAETDAFDGSTYMMQIRISDKGDPHLNAFFRTRKPTSKKLGSRPAAPLPTQGRTLRA